MLSGRRSHRHEIVLASVTACSPIRRSVPAGGSGRQSHVNRLATVSWSACHRDRVRHKIAQGSHTVDAKRALSKIWERSLRAGHWSGRAWTERAEDGRIRYAMAGAGVGLIIGSFTTTVDNTAGVTWAGLRVASISLVGFGLGLALLAITLVWPWIDEEWAWERRRKTSRQRLITEADDDPEFREELKADPRQAFAREFGRKTPDDPEITVLEQTPKHVYIVLQPSVLSRGPAATTSRAARWCECAWTERAEDGRVSYATAACGLGLLVGSVVAVIGDNAPLINWTGFGLARFPSLASASALACSRRRSCGSLRAMQSGRGNGAASQNASSQGRTAIATFGSS